MFTVHYYIHNTYFLLTEVLHRRKDLKCVVVVIVCHLSSVAVEFPHKYKYLYLLSSHVSTLVHRISNFYCTQDSAGQTRQRVTRRRGTTTATGDKMTARGRTATGGTTTAMGVTATVRVSRAMGSTTTAAGGMTTQHNNGGDKMMVGTMTARGSMLTGGTTMAMGSRATGGTTPATSGMTTRQNKGDGQHDDAAQRG